MKRSTFTSVPSRLAQITRPGRADLHVHTTASDGEYTPSQVLALARQANLAAIAITDHDIITMVSEEVARDAQAEIVAGVEISASLSGREVHLLGYYVRADHVELNRALAGIRDGRRERFHDFVAQLARNGVPLSADRVQLVADSSASLGRRHLAQLIVALGFSRSRHEAFYRWLVPLNDRVTAKRLLPVNDAIRLVHAAGGISSLAHPPSDFTDADFRALAECGLRALEVAYPWGRNSPRMRLREIADQLGLAVTGGSDCHGPDPSHRQIGSCGITVEQLAALRDQRVSCAF